MSRREQIQALVAQLLAAMEKQIEAGTIVLNINKGKLASVKTETYERMDASS